MPVSDRVVLPWFCCCEARCLRVVREVSVSFPAVACCSPRRHPHEPFADHACSYDILLHCACRSCVWSIQDENYSTGELKAFYDLEYNILLVLELTVALLMHATYKAYQKSKEQGTSRLYSDLAMPLAYAICSAIIGTQSVIQAKCMSELLTLTFQGDNQLVRRAAQACIGQQLFGRVGLWSS